MNRVKALPGSFRDPSGFVFEHDGELYRQINQIYRRDYDLLMQSGLYDALVAAGLLVQHEETAAPIAVSDAAYKILKPQRIPFISYPYEWCFSQLKAAALTTLKIQKIAFEHGMTLKDCSAYNVQFIGSQPVFIDTPSFETYREGQIWYGYRQFCEHFLAPLTLMAYRDVRLSRWFGVDGIELDIASKLLPLRTRLNLPLMTHIHLHAKTQQRLADKATTATARKMNKLGFIGLRDNLESAIRRLVWQPRGTEWADYYDNTNYSDAAMLQKQKWVAEFLDRVRPQVTWDLGANTGIFSLSASKSGSQTVAFDLDHGAVERHYRQCVERKDGRTLPLVMDLRSPSSGVGWENRERLSLQERGPADAVLSLALIHHLAISNNLPLERIARFFGTIGHTLIIEFVPKQDTQVQRLLATREDIFPDYTEDAFERAFSAVFELERRKTIEGSQRSLYLMRNRSVL